MSEKASQLFLFAPSKGWSYCGGATLICAGSLAEAIAIGNNAVAADKRLFAEGKYGTLSTIAEFGNFSETDSDSSEEWYFVEAFDLVFPRDVGVVFSDANHA